MKTLLSPLNAVFAYAVVPLCDKGEFVLPIFRYNTLAGVKQVFDHISGDAPGDLAKGENNYWSDFERNMLDDDIFKILFSISDYGHSRFRRTREERHAENPDNPIVTAIMRLRAQNMTRASNCDN